MTRTTTYVETLSGRYLGVIGMVGSVLLLVSLIIGASGPATFDISDTTAYLCPGDLHIWNSTICRGVQLSLPVIFSLTHSLFLSLPHLTLTHLSLSLYHSLSLSLSYILLSFVTSLLLLLCF
jgi:hypothetical protein